MTQFRIVVCFILIALVSASSLSAQNFTSDARLVGMGGIGGHANDAMNIAGEARSYRSIGLPIGLFQVLKNIDVYNPTKKLDFNPLRAVTLLASPLHYTFDLKENTPGEVLVRDLVQGKLNRDLNNYRGFAPKPQYNSLGLVSPTFGHTFRVKGEKDAAHQGVYFGVGPYLAIGTNTSFDQGLIDILSSSTNKSFPNSKFLINNSTNGQAAGAITVGYRGRFALPNQTGSDRTGVYVATNYNYLKGYRYDTADMSVRFDTDAAGLITLAPTTTPLTVNHTWAKKGNGLAVDVSTAVVIDRWEISVGATGLGNRITWSDFRSEKLQLGSLYQGLSFTKTSSIAPTGEVEIKLPVQYQFGGAYHANHWTGSSEFGHGLQDFEYKGGAEYRLSILEFRGGIHYKKKIWQPGAGAGLNLTKNFGIDAAIYGSATNIEEKRKPALALSLRFGPH